MIKKLLFLIFNPFFVSYYYRFCVKKIKELPADTQLFFITRRDFGTYPQLLNYIACWEEKRGKTALVFLTGRFDIIESLVRLICPATHLIGPDNSLACKAIAYFHPRTIHLQSFARVYARLAIDYEEALYLYNQASTYPPPSHNSSYQVYFDHYLKELGKFATPAFKKAYIEIRKLIDYREDVYNDQLDVASQQRDLTPLHQRIKPLLEDLKNKLCLQGPYVVININCKDYTHQHPDTNRKKIAFPERYNAIIDFLINKGFVVVIQGRDEQPVFQSRHGLIDYAKSPYVSPENDVALYAGSTFAILCKTGPEYFAMLADIPILGLNYVELCCMVPSTKLRFFPKNLKKKGRSFSWQQLLQEACYFDLGKSNFDHEVIYEDLSEEDMLTAVEEFLPLVQNNSWLDLTPLQKAYKESLNPLHLDQYRVLSVPCDVYLRRKCE